MYKIAISLVSVVGRKSCRLNPYDFFPILSRLSCQLVLKNHVLKFIFAATVVVNVHDMKPVQKCILGKTQCTKLPFAGRFACRLNPYTLFQYFQD